MIINKVERFAVWAQTSEDALQQEYVKTTDALWMYIRFRKILSSILVLSVLGGVIALISVGFAGFIDWSTLLCVLYAAIFLGWLFCVVMGEYYGTRYESLSPLAEVPYLCRRTLELVEAETEAKNWRDQVLSNGRQLRAFDYILMLEMKEAKEEASKLEKARLRLENQREQDKEACIALHTPSS